MQKERDLYYTTAWKIRGKQNAKKNQNIMVEYLS